MARLKDQTLLTAWFYLILIRITMLLLNWFQQAPWFRPASIILLTTMAGIAVLLTYRIYSGESTLAPRNPIRQYPLILIVFAAGYLIFSLGYTLGGS
jgi:hypothetical protein